MTTTKSVRTRYFRDTGLLHHLLSLSDERDLLRHPSVGASWESFALEEVLKTVSPSEAYFWATYAGAELDLLFNEQGQHFGVEMKFSESPKTTKSMHIALEDLKLKHLWVLHPGRKTYPMTTNITSLAIYDLSTLPERIDAFC